MQITSQFEDLPYQKSDSKMIAVIDPQLTYDYSKLEANTEQVSKLLANPGKKVNVLKSSQDGKTKLYTAISNENFTHQLMQMVHYSYYNHYPFSFSPDNIQLLISQGFCAHIKQNAEKFRQKFVQHEGQKVLKVIAPHRDYLNYDWPNIISQFSGKIKENISQEKYNLCVHKYSTTDEIAQTCYEVSLMDTMQKYFKYELGEGCGISRIKLLGTLDDWIKLKENTQKLREFELDWWIDKIIPVLDQFIQLYQGNVDHYFWKNIYRFIERDPELYEPTPEYATGWITYFFPYRVNENASIHVKNQFVRNDFSSKEEKYIKLTAKQIPSGISQAPVLFVNSQGQRFFDLEFNAGYIGVGMDEEGFLYSQQGWAVTQVEDLKKHKIPLKKEKNQAKVHEQKQHQLKKEPQKQQLQKLWHPVVPVEKSAHQPAKLNQEKLVAHKPKQSPIEPNIHQSITQNHQDKPAPQEKAHALHQEKPSQQKQPAAQQHVELKQKIKSK